MPESMLRVGRSVGPTGAVVGAADFFRAAGLGLTVAAAGIGAGFPSGLGLAVDVGGLVAVLDWRAQTAHSETAGLPGADLGSATGGPGFFERLPRYVTTTACSGVVGLRRRVGAAPPVFVPVPEREPPPPVTREPPARDPVLLEVDPELDLVPPVPPREPEPVFPPVLEGPLREPDPEEEATEPPPPFPLDRDPAAPDFDALVPAPVFTAAPEDLPLPPLVVRGLIFLLLLVLVLVLPPPLTRLPGDRGFGRARGRGRDLGPAPGRVAPDLLDDEDFDDEDLGRFGGAPLPDEDFFLGAAGRRLDETEIEPLPVPRGRLIMVGLATTEEPRFLVVVGLLLIAVGLLFVIVGLLLIAVGLLFVLVGFLFVAVGFFFVLLVIVGFFLIAEGFLFFAVGLLFVLLVIVGFFLVEHLPPLPGTVPFGHLPPLTLVHLPLILERPLGHFPPLTLVHLPLILERPLGHGLD